MRQILFAIASLFVFTAQANVLTVSNNPANVAQFNTIQAAIDAAADGDTILVHGSPDNYAGFNINNKKVAVIGPGWNPNKALPFTANIISTIGLTGVGASGSELHGLSIYTNINTNTGGINNIRFIRNRLYRQLYYLAPGGGGTLSGYLFEGNWFDDAGVISNNFISLQNIIFQNNIFYNNGVMGYSIGGFTNTLNVLFDHNLFYGGASFAREVFQSNTRFITLSNNIFVRNNPAINLSSASFYNNITFNTPNDQPWTINNNFDGGGNLAGVDPQMNAQASVNSGVNDPLLDFTIAAGPANNSGSDGKDRGLLFETVGSLNWTNARTSRLPYIYSMQTNTPTVAPGGSITVTVEARTGN
jgi:hypothetical protein